MVREYFECSASPTMDTSEWVTKFGTQRERRKGSKVLVYTTGISMNKRIIKQGKVKQKKGAQGERS
jgi:hypothetical protein